jgi:hypothetical protein
MPRQAKLPAGLVALDGNVVVIAPCAGHAEPPGRQQGAERAFGQHRVATTRQGHPAGL